MKWSDKKECDCNKEEITHHGEIVNPITKRLCCLNCGLPKNPPMGKIHGVVSPDEYEDARRNTHI